MDALGSTPNDHTNCFINGERSLPRFHAESYVPSAQYRFKAHPIGTLWYFRLNVILSHWQDVKFVHLAAFFIARSGAVQRLFDPNETDCTRKSLE